MNVSRRARFPRALVGAAGLVLLVPAARAVPAAAGTIRGQVELSGGTAHAAKLNPYPGRANALPGGAAPAAAGGVTETVVFVDKLPAGLAVPAPPAGRPELEQRGQAFGPRVLAIQQGTTVEFPNRDPIFHNVFSVSPARRFDLGKYPKGQSRRVRFDKPGLINVYCDIHSDMAAYIYVVPHHVFARPNAAGKFSLPELPAGTYTLRTWHPDHDEQSQVVQVPATGDVTVTVRM